MSELTLELKNLTIAYTLSQQEVFTAVKNASLSIPRGTTLALVGESGSGKSTLAAAVNLLLPDNGATTGGEILLEGNPIQDLTQPQMRSMRGAQIGLVPQDPMSNLNPMMTIGNQIAESLTSHGQTQEQAKDRALELLEMVGIPDPLDRYNQYPHEFSGGMRQRVLIAMGMACKPKLLIADEPTSALDVTVQRKVLDQLEQMAQEMGTAVLLITHDIALAAERADQIAVMYKGELVEIGPSSQVLNSPQHEYTKRLLAAAPSLNDASLVQPKNLATAETIISVKNLYKTYGLRSKRGPTKNIQALKNVGFEIKRGTTVSLVGESGSGKSTAANVLLGLEKPNSGEISFQSRPLDISSQRKSMDFRREVQPVFQNPFASLDPRFTVSESIIEPLRVHKKGNSKEQVIRAAELMDAVSLSQGLLTRLPHELSGGQRQRVAIARALALSPSVIILDEAVSALDVIVQKQILDLLLELQAELDLSYLFISHDLAVVRMISHYVHVMNAGEIVESGTPAELFENPQTDYTKQLLSAIPNPKRL